MLVDLLNRANTGYEDGFLSSYYDPITGSPVDGHGDGLAEFIVVELSETFDPEATEEEQLDEAQRVLEVAIKDLQNVVRALV